MRSQAVPVYCRLPRDCRIPAFSPKWTLHISSLFRLFIRPMSHSAGIRISGIGQSLRAIRQSRGLTSDVMATKLQIVQSTLSKYENGLRAVPLTLLEKLGGVLAIPPDVLVTWLLSARYPRLRDFDSEFIDAVMTLNREADAYVRCE